MCARMSERFGPYELQSRIGAGGMAETFRALRRGPGGIEQRVCIKRILPAWQDDARFVRMFLEEARIAARLRHATIVQVLDVGSHEGTPYLALELIEGTDLRRLIDHERAERRVLGADLLTLVALEVATALEHAHLEGVVHRDVSPANVLISAAGEVKLADFGIAKAADGDRHTTTGFAKGKIAYMAPEYAASGSASAASDLYSLGVTLFEAAAGRRPQRTPLAPGGAPRVSLARAAPHLPAPLVDIVERLLEPEPRARFESAERLFDALAELTPTASARRALGALARGARDAPARTDERTRTSEPPIFEEPTRPQRPVSS